MRTREKTTIAPTKAMDGAGGRLLVATDARLGLDGEGNVRSSSPAAAYEFWARYLQVFPNVTLLARVRDGADPSWPLVEGCGVKVARLPPYGSLSTPIDFLRAVPLIWRRASEADAVIARLPGHVGGLLLPVCRLLGKPFSVEVVGDPWEVFASGVVDVWGRRTFRVVFAAQLRWACSRAVSVGYVSRIALPKRYPAAVNSLVDFYSSISLPDSAFVKPVPPITRSRSELTLITVGSMDQRYKGIDTFLEAIAICRLHEMSVKALIVGDGRFRHELESLAENLGVPVCFTGQLATSSDVREMFCRSDLFVLASRTEGLPRVLIEAMAIGLPAIATDVGGVSELLPSDCLVSRDDADALAEKIMTILSDSEALHKASVRNARTAENYRPAILVKRRSRVYGALRDVASR